MCVWPSYRIKRNVSKGARAHCQSKRKWKVYVLQSFDTRREHKRRKLFPSMHRGFSAVLPLLLLRFALLRRKNAKASRAGTKLAFRFPFTSWLLYPSFISSNPYGSYVVKTRKNEATKLKKKPLNETLKVYVYEFRTVCSVLVETYLIRHFTFWLHIIRRSIEFTSTDRLKNILKRK